MYHVKVIVTLKESVVDPQGSAALKAAQDDKFPMVQDIRIGKCIELQIDRTEEDIEKIVHALCEDLLVNTVIEDYRIEIEEVETK